MQRGDIFFVNLDPTVGREQSGVRPVVVVSGDRINRRPLVLVGVPGTDGANVPTDYSHSVRVPPDDSGLSRETVFLCFQVRALDRLRFPSTPAGRLSGGYLDQIEDALRFVLDL